MFVNYLVLVLFVVSYSNGADILAIIPTPSYSHQIAYTYIWRELSLRGHKVTVITTDPLKDPSLTNLTEIDMKWLYQLVGNISNIAENTLTMWNIYDITLDIMLNISDALLSHPPVQDLLQRKRNFDVLLVEFSYPELLAFAEVYRCPKILISPVDTIGYYHEKMGNPSHPVLHPDMSTPFFGSMNFIERVTSTLYSLYVFYFFDFKVIPKRQEMLKRYFDIEKTVEELLRDVDMMFLNVNPVIQGSKALGPSTISIGGQRAAISTKPLSMDLAEFLDSAKDGFIYFSLGSNVKSKDLKKDSLKAIIESLAEVPYKVLWKFEADTLPGKPDNVKLVKWAPQQNVLAHPNIKLFVTQGGLQSMEEALYSEVPFVVIPYFGDQEQNAKLMESKGIAKIVGRQPLKKTELKSAILEVINNPSYKNSVVRLKRLALDSPMTGLEKAVWWTEYVIRNKGAKHLRNPAADLPFYQYYLIDVISFLLLVTVSVSVTIFILVKQLFKLINTFLVKQTLSKKLQ